jgi:hypothetical protein
VIAFVAGAGTVLLSGMVIAWIRTTLNMCDRRKVRLQAAHGPSLCTQLYFPGEARNASDSLFRPDLFLKIRETNSVHLATFKFVLEVA